MTFHIGRYDLYHSLFLGMTLPFSRAYYSHKVVQPIDHACSNDHATDDHMMST